MIRVKSFKTNRFGIYIMRGNDIKWVAYSYEKFYYNSSLHKNPVNKNKTKYKITKGGFFKFSDKFPTNICFRSFDKPTHQFNDLDVYYKLEKKYFLVFGI